VISEFLSFSVDFFSSVVNPDEVFLGGGDFRFDVFSVGSGFVTDGFILIGNSGQVLNLSSFNLFVRSVNFISSGLSIDVSLL